MRRCPALMIAEQASVRLQSLRELSRRLYFLYGGLGGLREFVLAVSIRADTVWIWMVFPRMDDPTRDDLALEADRYGVMLVDLSLVEAEEAERFRERYVKGTESYQIRWDADIDGLFDLFEERFASGD